MVRQEQYSAFTVIDQGKVCIGDHLNLVRDGPVSYCLCQCLGFEGIPSGDGCASEAYSASVELGPEGGPPWAGTMRSPP